MSETPGQTAEIDSIGAPPCHPNGRWLGATCGWEGHPHVLSCSVCAAHREDPNDPSVFIGSSALLTALLDTYVEHIGIPETDGPDGPYMGCCCGWRSDDLSNDNPGLAYAIHLTNAQHAAAVKALQPLVVRVNRPAPTTKEASDG